MPEKNLQVLLSSIQPRLSEETYVFCSVRDVLFDSLNVKPLCTFRENEGVTMILPQSEADRISLDYGGTWSMITCETTSDLNAVGFLAAMTRQLSEAGIPTNAVSAYHHDHLFVPSDRAEKALFLLQSLQASSTPRAPERINRGDINELIAHIFKEHRAFKATGSLLTQGVALINRTFKHGLPDDMKRFYERCNEVKVFDRYSFLSLQRSLEVDRAKLPTSWMPFCELPTGRLLAIDLSAPDELYPVIDLECEDFEYLVVSRSFTEFVAKILTRRQDTIFWVDESEQCGTVSVTPSNEQDRMKYQSYWDSLSDEYGPEKCQIADCENLRINLSVLCKQHQFERVQKVACPFVTDEPKENVAHYKLKDSSLSSFPLS